MCFEGEIALNIGEWVRCTKKSILLQRGNQKIVLFRPIEQRVTRLRGRFLPHSCKVWDKIDKEVMAILEVCGFRVLGSSIHVRVT